MATESVPREAGPAVAADLILYGGAVLTMDERGTRTAALAIRGGKILLAGSDRDVLRFAGTRTHVVHLDGRAALPGFIETHSHPMGFGSRLRGAIDAGTPPNITVGDILDRVAGQVRELPRGTWIRGMGYDDTLLQEMRHPNRHDLDRVAPEHPVYLTHVSGHLAVANSVALRLAGITDGTPDPPGAQILRDEDGALTGVLVEMAAQILVARLLPQPTEEEMIACLAAASDSYPAAGITTAHDTGVGFMGGAAAIGAYREAIATRRFRPRMYAFLADRLLPQLGDGVVTPLAAALSGLGDDRFRLGAVKLLADGSIQGLSGALSEPYACAPNTCGVLTHSQDLLNTKVRALHDAGWHIGIHGNGDAGIEAILDAYAAALQANPRPNHRYRIEHCQMAREDQLDRMAELGVCASYFVKHVYYWGDRHRDIFIGERRAARLDPLASAERRGIRFGLHSDTPVTPIPPLFGIWAAVNRITRNGAVLGPDQRVSVQRALRAYTSDAAYLSFEEQVKGTLEPGKFGDVVVLSADPAAVPALELDRLRPEMTIIGGEVAWEATA